VGFTTGSRGEVPGKKDNLRQEMMMIIIQLFILCAESTAKRPITDTAQI
jgi:hypothetical protein